MQKTKTLAVLSAFLSFASLGLSAAPAQAGGSYLLRHRLKQGAKRAYAMTMNTTMDTSKMPKQQGQTMPKTIKMDMRIAYTLNLTAVESDKQTWKMAITDATMKSNMKGNVMGDVSRMKGETATIVMNSRGKVLSMKGSQNLQGMTMGSQSFTGLTFPEKPVKVGSTWKDAVSQGGMKMTLANKVAGVSRLGNVNALLIHTTIQGNSMFLPGSLIKSWINPATGELLKGQGNLKLMVMMPVTTTYSIARK